MLRNHEVHYIETMGRLSNRTIAAKLGSLEMWPSYLRSWAPRGILRARTLDDQSGAQIMRKTSTLLFALTLGYLLPAHGRADTSLFTPVGARYQDEFEETSSPTLRSRDVALDSQRITAIEAAQAQSLVLNLFPDATYTAT